MFSLSECKYYSPCGLCTFYNTECKEMRKRKSKGKSLCNSCMGKLDDGPNLNIGETDEQHLSPKISIKRKFWKGVIYE